MAENLEKLAFDKHKKGHVRYLIGMGYSYEKIIALTPSHARQIVQTESEKRKIQKDLEKQEENERQVQNLLDEIESACKPQSGFNYKLRGLLIRIFEQLEL